MKQSKLILSIIVVTVITGGVIPFTAVAAEQVVGQPSLEVYSPNNQVSPGEETTLQVYTSNLGKVTQSGPSQFEERVTTARDVTLELKSGSAPVDINTGRFPIGDVRAGQQQSQPTPFEITVSEDADPGTYRIPVNIKYTYSTIVEYSGTQVTDTSEVTVTQTKNLRLVVRDSARFRIVETTSNALVGQEGNFSMTVENIGTEPASEASVSIQSSSDELTFGTSSTMSESFVGNWMPGERKQIPYTVRFAEDAQVRSYTLKSTITYEDTDGVSRTSKELTTSLTPDGEQSFDVTDIESTLRVGDEGTLRGTIVNNGPQTVYDPVLELSVNNPNINPSETAAPISTLEPGESASFAYDVDVSDAANMGTKQFTLSVDYEDAAGDSLTSDSLTFRVDVSEQRDEFVIEPLNRSVEAGSSSIVSLRVTNNGDETLTDISVKTFLDDPLSSSDDEAFIPVLEPGESEEITVSISAGSDALVKTYPVSMDLQYTEPDGDTRVSDTYKIPIEVFPSSGGGFPVIQLVLALGVVGVGGVFIWRRYRS